MLNNKEREIWMNERMAKGYSFKYTKKVVGCVRLNASVTCVETNETFVFIWPAS